MQFRVSPKTLTECSDEQWQARIDLPPRIGCGRCTAFSEGIFNHLTLACSAARPLLSDSVRAALVRGHGEVLYGSRVTTARSGRRGRGRAVVLLHPRADPQGLPQATPAFHTHEPYASALSAWRSGASSDRPDRDRPLRRRRRRRLHRSGARSDRGRAAGRRDR